MCLLCQSYVRIICKISVSLWVITPFKSKTKVEGIRKILIESNIQQVFDAITDEEFVKGRTFLMPIGVQIDVSIEDNRNAIRSPEAEVIDLLNNQKIDVLLTVPWFGCEASYYIAHKYNSSLGRVWYNQ